MIHIVENELREINCFCNLFFKPLHPLIILFPNFCLCFFVLCLSYCVVQPELGSIAHIVERWSRTNCLCELLLRDPFDVAPLSPGHEDVDGGVGGGVDGGVNGGGGDDGLHVECLLIRSPLSLLMVFVMVICDGADYLWVSPP